MNATRTARRIFSGVAALLLIGVLARAQSTPSSAAVGKALAAGGTATTAKTATADGMKDKAESLTVASKEYDAVKELDRMAKRYGLTADQKSKIEPLLLAQQKAVHELGEDDSLTDSQWRGDVRKVHQQTVLKIKHLLTDKQLSKYAKDEEKRAKASGDDSDDGDDGPPDGPPPDGGPPGGGGPGGGGPPPGGGGPPGE